MDVTHSQLKQTARRILQLGQAFRIAFIPNHGGRIIQSRGRIIQSICQRRPKQTLVIKIRGKVEARSPPSPKLTSNIQAIEKSERCPQTSCSRIDPECSSETPRANPNKREKHLDPKNSRTQKHPRSILFKVSLLPSVHPMRD